MTLLQDRPETEAAEAPSPPASAAVTETWLNTTDHKRIGLLFVYTSLLFARGWRRHRPRRRRPAGRPEPQPER